MSVRAEVIRIFNELLVNSKKITQLPSGNSPDGTELIEAVQGGSNVKFTVSQLGGGGGTQWQGAYDLAANSPDYPPGSHTSGDIWYNSTSGDLDVEGLGVITLNVGSLLVYLGGAVQTPSSWKVIQ